MTNEKLKILAVEDDPDDVEILQDFLATDPSHITLNVVNDGEAALAYLMKTPPFTDAVSPNLVLLDLNLPKKNGKEVLTVMRSHTKLRHIPVLVLTTSDHKREITDLYTRGANCYLVKPARYKEIESLFDTIKKFWGTMVKYP